MDTVHEPLHLDKWSLVQWEIMDLPTSLIWIVILFDEIFKQGDGAKYWAYVETNSEPLCVEFCNFVQCHTFVAYFFLKITILCLLSVCHTL
jgi:hypothetical protein